MIRVSAFATADGPASAIAPAQVAEVVALALPPDDRLARVPYSTDVLLPLSALKRSGVFHGAPCVLESVRTGRRRTARALALDRAGRSSDGPRTARAPPRRGEDDAAYLPPRSSSTSSAPRRPSRRPSATRRPTVSWCARSAARRRRGAPRR